MILIVNQPFAIKEQIGQPLTSSTIWGPLYPIIVLRSLKKPALLFSLSLLVGLLPVFSVGIASWISTANNCVLHEGSANPCVVQGVDLGETLYALGVMGWLMIFSLPLGAIGIVVALVWALLNLLKRFSHRR